MVLIDTIFTIKQKYAWAGFALIYIYLTPVTCEPRKTGAVEEVNKIITCSLVLTWVAGAFILSEINAFLKLFVLYISMEF